MKFHRVVGKFGDGVIDKTEAILSRVFLELGLSPNNEFAGSKFGGDPLIFSLMYPMQHIATTAIPTAATDGRRYYWNPKFVLSKSKIGLRLVCEHEAWHAIYTHPERRGKRLPKLWNVAVDFVVNGNAMDNLRARKMDPGAVFKKELGNFVTLENYADYFRNPFKPIKGSEDWVPEPPELAHINFNHPGDDKELTEEQLKKLAASEKKVKYYFADPELPKDMRRPEKIYDYLFKLLPKCDKCGKVGMYKIPEKPNDPILPHKHSDEKPKDEPEEQDSQDESEENADQQDSIDETDHNHDDDDNLPTDDQHACDSDSKGKGNGPSKPGSSGKGSAPGKKGQSAGTNGTKGPCGSCGGGYDIFDFGDTLDEHIDADEAPEAMAKRMADAIASAKQMAGSIPAALEDELGKLLAPKVRWQDLVRVKMSKARDGNTKNDWTRFKSRPLFAGLFNPKKTNQICRFACLLDTSASMSREMMTWGVSQLQSIDERSEGWIVPADATIYWKEATKLRRVNPAEISQVKIVGRGGTKYAEFFRDYKKELGANIDFLILITDGQLLVQDVAEMVNPGIDVIWLITGGSIFDAPFGRVFDLDD